MAVHGRDRQPDREHGAYAVGSVCGQDRAAHRLDEAARDGEPEAGARAHMVAFARPVELVENVLEVMRRYSLALVQDLDRNPIALLAASNAYRRAVESV